MSSNSKEKDIYDYPEYYDVLFGWDREPEVNFLHSVFNQYLPPSSHLLELASGTGTTSRLLSQKGWTITGIDISPEMVEYSNRKKDSSPNFHSVKGDMNSFSLPQKVHGAYILLGSIGLLDQASQIIPHLLNLSKHLESQGLYLIDLGLCLEPWQRYDYSQSDFCFEKQGVEVQVHNGTVYVSDKSKDVKLTLPWKLCPIEFNWQYFEDLVHQSKEFKVLHWFPEVELTEEGVSIFDYSHKVNPEETPRAMVLLQKLT